MQPTSCFAWDFSNQFNWSFEVFRPEYFVQASEFTERLQNILPEMPIIGGTVRSNAWGQANQKEQSMRGALFLNSDTYDSGAVGCILQGDLEVFLVFILLKAFLLIQLHETIRSVASACERASVVNVGFSLEARRCCYVFRYRCLKIVPWEVLVQLCSIQTWTHINKSTSCWCLTWNASM